jgi:hypothetical protein
MKSMKIFTLIIALIAGHYCLLNAQPVISNSPMPATLSNINISPLAIGTGIQLHDNASNTHAEVKVTIGSGDSISGRSKGVDIDGTSTSAAITNATITTNANGISVINGGKLTNCANKFNTHNTNNGISVETTAGAIDIITENDLSRNGIKAINKLSDPIHTATYNWWGSPTVVTSKFSGNVTYYPWLFDGTDNALPMSGFQPVPNSCLNPPICCITSPVNNFVSSDNAPIYISAEASVLGGHIRKVEFFLNTVKIGVACSVPFNFTLVNPPTGNQVLTAKATDLFGISTVSAPVTITVKCIRYDLNHDNIVDVNDFLRFAVTYGSHCSNCPEDFNVDGIVDLNDYVLFISKYGYTSN